MHRSVYFKFETLIKGDVRQVYETRKISTAEEKEKK